MEINGALRQSMGAGVGATEEDHGRLLSRGNR